MSAHAGNRPWQTDCVLGNPCGKEGGAHALFMTKNVVALADAGLGNLGRLEASRLAFAPLRMTDCIRMRRSWVHRTSLESSSASRSRSTSEILFCIRHCLIKTYTLARSWGTICSKTSDCAAFPHQRPVVWKYVIGKSELSAEANNELGSARTFFRFKRHVDEVLEKISRKALRLARLLLLGR